MARIRCLGVRFHPAPKDPRLMSAASLGSGTLTPLLGPDASPAPDAPPRSPRLKTSPSTSLTTVVGRPP